jgi:TonB family protein
MLRTLAGSFLFSLCSLVSMGQTPKEATEPLHVKKFVAPAYPDAARKNRMQGTTTAEIQVGADGAVDFVKVVMAHPVFHDYVEAALKQWTFDPIAKPARLKVNVRFWLDACGDLARSNQGEPIVGETVVKADLPDNVEVRTCLDPIVTNVN